MNPKLKARLFKLLALSESGNKHEADNAMSRLKTLCSKHGVTLEELTSENEEVTMHWFRYSDAFGKRVLVNTIWRATDINNCFRNSSKQRQVGVKCTKSQAAEIRLWWSVMRKAFEQHLDDTTSAFIAANGLYGKSELDSDDSDFDWEAWERQQALARNIKATSVHKALESK